MLEDDVCFLGRNDVNRMRNLPLPLNNPSRSGRLGTDILPASLNSQADARHQLADFYTALSLDTSLPTRTHPKHTGLVRFIRYQNQAFGSLRRYNSRKERRQTSTGSDLLFRTRVVSTPSDMRIMLSRQSKVHHQVMYIYREGKGGKHQPILMHF